MIPDVNLLVAAVRTDHRHHATAFERLNRACAELTTGGTLLLPDAVVAGCLRIVTNRRIFSTITPLDTALGFVDDLMRAGANPAAGPDWPSFRSYCTDHGTLGALVSDAWLAATALHHRERLVTFDRDFTRLLPLDNLELLDRA